MTEKAKQEESQLREHEPSIKMKKEGLMSTPSAFDQAEKVAIKQGRKSNNAEQYD